LAKISYTLAAPNKLSVPSIQGFSLLKKPLKFPFKFVVVLLSFIFPE